MSKFFIFVLCLSMFGVSISAQSGRTVNYDGINYQIVTTARDFLIAYRDSKPAALLFKINDYHTTVNNIMNEGERLNISYSQAFSPTTVARANNLQVYSMGEIFTVMQGGQLNPNNDAYLFNNARPVSTSVSRDSSARNLKTYFRYLAGLWWPQRNPRDTDSSHSGTPGARICDSCSNDILFGEGFIYGYYANRNLVAYRLWCENCIDELIESYRKNGLTREGGFFEEEDVSRANDYVNSK